MMDLMKEEEQQKKKQELKFQSLSQRTFQLQCTPHKPMMNKHHWMSQKSRKKAAAERLSSMQEQKHGLLSSWKRETPLNQEKAKQNSHTHSLQKKIRFLCITKSMDSFYFKSSLRSSAQSPQGSTKN